jgi:mannose-6-phosphate isomerase-like protein (cupin superfamily)
MCMTGCVAHPTPRLLTGNPPRAIEVSVLEAQTPLGPTDNIRRTEMAVGEHSSVAFVQIRDREQSHVHSRYDLTVTLVDGAGTLWLNGTALPMRAGDVAYIPRGTPHYFVNGGRTPAATLVSSSPPFSGPDQQPAP